MAMNLGNTVLKSVNTKQPQLLHSDSKRSITASDDYYSLSDRASLHSSGDERATITRFDTPPSRIHSAVPSRDDLLTRAQPELHLETYQEEPETAALPQRHSVQSIEEHSIPRKPVAAHTMNPWRASTQSHISPPTPGVDDTPYIQFAIDQLTRDEELTGRSRAVRGSGAVSPLSEIGEEVPIDRAGDEKFRPGSSKHQDGAPREDSVSPITPEGELSNNVLIPAQPPVDNFRYPPLNFVPQSLRLLPVATLAICCLLMIIGLVFSFVWALKHDGLWAYDGVGTPRYFLFEFLPQILAAILLVWMMVIQNALQRILPFALLARSATSASENEKGRQPARQSYILDDVPLFLTNYFFPDLTGFRHGEYLLGFCSIVFWLNLFTIPLMSSLFQTRLYQVSGQGVWTWTVVQPVAWVLVAIYVLLFLALISLPLHFSRRTTGLKWDPVSLADIFVLLRGSNVMPVEDTGFQRSSRRRTVISRPASLGYWEASNRPGQVLYGIGENRAPVRQYSVRKGKIVPSRPQEGEVEGQGPMHASTFDSWHSDVPGQRGRYYWTPWFLKDTWVVAWLLIALFLMIAFVVISFVNGNVDMGFLPLLPAPTTALGFSAADFLYSFVPSLVGLILFLAWLPIDRYFRALQPFARLSQFGGATAERSLLLNYTATLPLQTTMTALVAGDLKVAWFSLVSVLALTLPVLGGGLFTALFERSSQQIRETACMPAYDALVVFVIIYAFSYLIIWPTKRRYLPNDVRTLAQLMSHVGQSPLLRDEAFRDPRTKTDLVTRLVLLPKGTSTPLRYGYGTYLGRDAREHVGIDRLQRPGEMRMSMIARK